MRILVTGANGFIGSEIVAALAAAGHCVVAAVRRPRATSHADAVEEIACDLGRDVDVARWIPRLERIDAVVNVAGILRESRNETFDAIHHRAPLALARACVECGIRRFVQISAVGDARVAEFIASKHRADDALLKLDLDAVVIRPALVYSARGSHGGTSLLRAFAASPLVMPLPGDGEQRLQPVDNADVARLVAAVLAHAPPMRGVIEFGGPETMSLREYLLAWRRWLGIAPPIVVRVPMRLVRVAAMLGEWFGSGPLGRTTVRMLQRDVVADRAASTFTGGDVGIAPRALADILRQTPARTQDRWHARLYPLVPLLRTTLAIVWIVSGVLGLALSPDAFVAMAPEFVPAAAWIAVARVTGAIDLLLGIALLLLRRRRRLVLAAMLAMLAGYTAGFGVLVPSSWLDPLGGLLKNIVLFVAVGVALACDDARESR